VRRQRVKVFDRIARKKVLLSLAGRLGFAGDEKRLSSGRRRGVNHLTAAFEDHAFIHAETRGENVSPEDCRVVDLHAVLGMHRSVHFAADDDGAGLDRSVDSRAFANNQSVGSVDFPTKRTANTDGALKTKLTFKFATVVDNTGNCVLGGRNT
jgi:hypothetical protein